MRTLSEGEQKRIIVNMNRRLQGQVLFDLDVRTELAKTARGKQLRVIQKCKIADRIHSKLKTRK